MKLKFTMAQGDGLSPRNLYERMEYEREHNCGTGVRELYAPVFLAKLLKEQLELPKNSKSEAGHIQTDDISMNYHQEGISIGIGMNKINGSNTSGPPFEIFNVESFLFMSDVIRDGVDKVLRFGQVLRSAGVLNINEFCRQFCEHIKSPPLELMWLLDRKYDLVTTSSYIIMLTQKEYFLMSEFSHRFVALCLSPTLFRFRGKAVEILEGFLEALVVADECNFGKNSSLLKVKNYSKDILRQITLRLIDDKNIVTMEDHQFVLQTLSSLPLSVSVKQRFFSRQLDYILSTKSEFTVEQVIQKQEALSKISTNAYKVATINTLIESPQDPTKVIQLILSKTRKAELINWENVLLTVTLWEQKYSQETGAVRTLKEGIKKLMLEGLAENQPNKVEASLILARHCSLIAPEIFFRYEKWYNSIVAKENQSPLRELHVFHFFTEFITKWIPVEPLCFLQVQVTYWPCLPQAPGCRTLWAEYVSLAKARIQEFNEIEEAMGFEIHANNPLQRDVETAIKLFASTGKIPQVILEMIMFRKAYYKDQFLPCLLRKPPGVQSSDARLRLIELLNSEARIPSDLYAKYKAGDFMKSGSTSDAL